jgi:hypothetical protein
MSQAKPPTRLLLLALLAAITIGIVGMHGFTRHGAMPVHDAAHHQAASAEIATGPAVGQTAVAFMSAEVDSSVAALGNSGPSTGEMLMLCAAMLLVAAASALLAVRLRRLASAGGFSVDRLLSGTVRLLPARTGTGPPYVWEFSVVRC